MGRNKLVLNSDKTHLLVMASAHKHRKHENFGIVLNTGAEIIEPISDEKLLGGQISNNFTWNNHIRDNKTSMFKILTSKINALSKISKIANFRTRKMVASGLIMSTLNYLVQLYGSCSGYLVKLLQVLQNKAARHVTRLGWDTETSVLLNQCGWLSIKQLIVFQSLVLLFKIRQNKKPGYLFNKIDKKCWYKTRLAENKNAKNRISENRIFEKEQPKKTSSPEQPKTEIICQIKRLLH